MHENVAALRIFLGSAERPLSLSGLARTLNRADGRARSASTVQRWEEGAEPDLSSIRIMAQLAGVSFEAFALGTGEPRPLPAAAFEPMDAKALEAEKKRRGKRAG